MIVKVGEKVDMLNQIVVDDNINRTRNSEANKSEGLLFIKIAAVQELMEYVPTAERRVTGSQLKKAVPVSVRLAEVDDAMCLVIY